MTQYADQPVAAALRRMNDAMDTSAEDAAIVARSERVEHVLLFASSLRRRRGIQDARAFMHAYKMRSIAEQRDAAGSTAS